MAALEQAEKLRKARYEAIQREESRVLREQPPAPPEPIKTPEPTAEPAVEPAADPFAVPEEKPAPKAGKKPAKPARTAVEPAADEPARSRPKPAEKKPAETPPLRDDPFAAPRRSLPSQRSSPPKAGGQGRRQ